MSFGICRQASPRWLVALALLVAAIAAFPAARAEAADATSAYYLVLQRNAAGDVEVVHSEIVQMSAPLVSLSDAEMEERLAAPGRETDEVPISLRDPQGVVVYQTTVAVPRWVRGEFQSPNAPANGESPIEGHVEPLDPARHAVFHRTATLQPHRPVAQGIRRLTRIDVGEGKHVPITDDRLFDFPWIYATQAAYWDLSDIECARLRDYLARGGFLVVDDFHGPRDWAAFRESMDRVLPGLSITDIDFDHDPLMNVVYRIRVDGKEHLPREGAVILAANHRSFLDSIFIPLLVRRKVTFVAKAEYFDDPRTAWFFRAVGQIPIRREGGNASEGALAAATDVLRAGGVFGIYPEGTRTRDGYLVRIEPPLADFPGPDPVADAIRVNGIIERHVRLAPAEYFWIHRRFKGRPSPLPDPYR